MNDLSRLLSLLSHELRSPLGVVRGYLRLLDQTGAALSDQQRQAIAAALRASDRVADLLAQTSLLAELERGETVFDRRRLAFGTLVSKAAGDVPLPAEPLVRLDVAPSPDFWVMADEGLLGRALSRLVAFVVRAQPHDATVHVTSRPQAADEAAGVRLDISTADEVVAFDAGPLDISRGGAGVDLPIADRIVGAHGGHIRELHDRARATSALAGVTVWLPATTGDGDD